MPMKAVHLFVAPGFADWEAAHATADLTSNGLAYLRRHVPEYADSKSYVEAPTVRDRGLITASGLSDVEFAQELMAELRVLDDAVRERWAMMFRSGRFPEGGA